VRSLDKATGRDRYFAALEREVEALVDPETGMLSERYSRVIDCPLCAAGAHSPIFVKRGYTFVRCDVCRLVFANPQVDEALVLERYGGATSADLWAEVLLSERQLELDRPKFAAILDELEPFRGGGRLLDVGCSIGVFLDLARGRGWDGLGIELGGRALSHAREQLGLDVIDVPLAEAGLEAEAFDVVTVLSVLEHTNDPRAMVREVARVLRPGGALYVITPNVESLACRVLHERAATFDGRNHLIYFSPATLRELLEREGFTPIAMRTTVSSLDAVLEWLAYEQPYSGSDISGDTLGAHIMERRSEVGRLLEELDLGYKQHCMAVKHA
jgi:2-polyprenyl-3-methyl-5-hydroxy-6-metoxy-1,4-benzoquinol methylase